jgi:hypothetical protein
VTKFIPGKAIQVTITTPDGEKTTFDAESMTHGPTLDVVHTRRPELFKLELELKVSPESQTLFAKALRDAQQRLSAYIAQRENLISMMLAAYYVRWNGFPSRTEEVTDADGVIHTRCRHDPHDIKVVPIQMVPQLMEYARAWMNLYANIPPHEAEVLFALPYDDRPGFIQVVKFVERAPKTMN